jgi:YVTN family beta-propeller protein
MSSTPPPDAFTDGMAAAMMRMDAGMDIASSGDADHDFAAMMIPHHQGAIDMAMLELQYGKNPILKRLARGSSSLSSKRSMMRKPARHQPIPVGVTMRRGWFAAALLVGLTVDASAGQVPGRVSAPDIPISGRDRVYVAEQFSNTVSVIDPSRNELLGQIRLGDPQPANLSPLYKGELLVHGLGFSPDHRTLAVVSVGSNSVALIDTATNAVKRTVYLGRAPHEAFFTPDGGELWVTVRGED